MRVNHIVEVWKAIGIAIQGKGKVLSCDEISVTISPSKEEKGVLEIIVEQTVIKAMEGIIISEHAKLRDGSGGNNLLCYLAFCGGVDFSPRKIKVRDHKLLFALSYTFGQALEEIKSRRIEEGKKAILDMVQKISEASGKKCQKCYTYYSGGVFNVVFGNKNKGQRIFGVNPEAVVENVKKFCMK